MRITQFVGIMEQRTWKLLEEYDPKLKMLANKHPFTVLHNHAGNTVQKYSKTYRRWKIWVHIEVLKI